MTKFPIIFLIMILVFAPVLSSAQLVTDECGQIGADGKLVECGWVHLMNLIKRVIDFILFTLALPIAAVMFAYAGFLLVVPGGESGSKRSKAKGIFWNAAIGIILAAGAWIIVNTLLQILGYDGDWIGF